MKATPSSRKPGARALRGCRSRRARRLGAVQAVAVGVCGTDAEIVANFSERRRARPVCAGPRVARPCADPRPGAACRPDLVAASCASPIPCRAPLRGGRVGLYCSTPSAASSRSTASCRSPIERVRARIDALQGARRAARADGGGRGPGAPRAIGRRAQPRSVLVTGKTGRHARGDARGSAGQRCVLTASVGPCRIVRALGATYHTSFDGLGFGPDVVVDARGQAGDHGRARLSPAAASIACSASATGPDQTECRRGGCDGAGTRPSSGASTPTGALEEAGRRSAEPSARGRAARDPASIPHFARPSSLGRRRQGGAAVREA